MFLQKVDKLSVQKKKTMVGKVVNFHVIVNIVVPIL